MVIGLRTLFALSARDADMDDTRAAGLRVLVVDDQAPIRQLLRRYLEQWGYRVSEASHATEAVECILAQRPAIVLIDIRMPGRGGLWLVTRIRAKWREIAIIIASGADEIEVVERSRRLGAVDYVSKPFDRERLRQALRRAESVWSTTTSDTSKIVASTTTTVRR